MTNQQRAPEALRLADKYAAAHAKWALEDLYGGSESYTAEMLAERHAARERLAAALVEAQQPAAHVQKPAEIEHVAGDVSKNGPESNMAQPPAPSEQQPFGWIKQSEIDMANNFGGSINLWRRQYNCDVPVYLAQQPAPSAAALVEDGCVTQAGHNLLMAATRASATLVHHGRMAADADTPTPQADSQPAPVEVADAMADSQYLAGVSAGWNAANADDPNAALQKLHESRAGYLKPLRAARAATDSVTAPAGGVSLRDEFEAHWRRKYAPLPMNTRMRDDGRYGDPTIQQEWEAWQAAAPPAQAAPSVLEDAARLERERICAAIKAEDDYCVDHGDYMLDSDDCIKIVRGEWVRPDFSVDAARKQGANHD